MFIVYVSCLHQTIESLVMLRIWY